MALRNLMILGDKDTCVKQSTGWLQSDIDLLHSQAGLLKIHRAFQKTPFNFNVTIYFCKSIQLAHSEAGNHPDMVKSDCINIMHSNNLTGPSNRMPMNAWTIAHRFAHCIQASKVPGTSESGIIDTIGNACEILIGKMVKRDGGRIHGFGHQINEFLMLVMTMRSARMGVIFNDLDFLGELLAQYIITGKVSLLKAEHWGERMQVLGGDDKNYQSRYDNAIDMGKNILQNKTVYQINHELAYLEDSLNRQMHAFLESCVGKLAKF
jgi:hypothetical protein